MKLLFIPVVSMYEGYKKTKKNNNNPIIRVPRAKEAFSYPLIPEYC